LSAALVDQFPGIRIRQNQQPLGYGENHNRALEHVAADYLLLANDDLVFDPDCVARCVDFLERSENARVAALTPKLLNPDRTLQRSTYGFPTVPRGLMDLAGIRGWIPHNRITETIARPMGRGAGRSRFWPHDRTCDVDTFRGAALFVRSQAWHDVGPISELTRMGGEMGEWHRRCHDRGWRVVFFAEASVIHYANRAMPADPMLRSEHFKGYLGYFGKHRGRFISFCFRAVAIPIAALRVAFAVLSRDHISVLVWRNTLSMLVHPPTFDSIV
jgi:GT2 family glycosyltransferase